CRFRIVSSMFRIDPYPIIHHSAARTQVDSLISPCSGYTIENMSSLAVAIGRYRFMSQLTEPIQERIIIIGAGPCGLAAAIELQAIGIDQTGRAPCREREQAGGRDSTHKTTAETT